MNEQSSKTDVNERPESLSYAERGYSESIDTAFASLQETQIELSHMADSKANIMITVCSILLTLVVAQIQSGSLIYAASVFAVFAALALLFAILCVMPSSAAPKLPPGEVELPKEFNPMFFMNFSAVSMKTYEKQIERIMTDPQQLYEHLSRDIYYAGKVLKEKKYRYLRWSYICLILGVFSAAAVMLVELLTGA